MIIRDLANVFDLELLRPVRTGAASTLEINGMRRSENATPEKSCCRRFWAGFMSRQ